MPHTLEKIIGGSRAAVLRSLNAGMRSVGEIVHETGLSQPNVSNHLARLREQGLVVPQREGKRIFYSIANPDLVRALLTVPPVVQPTREQREKAIQKLAPAFEREVLALNHESARNLVDQALSEGFAWQDLYLRVFEPLLVQIGELWECGTLSVSEEHASSQLVERVMSHVAALRIPAPKHAGSEIVVACAEGEYHQIGSRMLADFLAWHGWGVVFLGANVPNEAMLAYIQRYHPGVIAVSASTEERLPAINSLAQRIQGLANGTPAPQLIVGGPLFRHRPDLVAEVAAPYVPTVEDAITTLNGGSRLPA